MNLPSYYNMNSLKKEKVTSVSLLTQDSGKLIGINSSLIPVNSTIF